MNQTRIVDFALKEFDLIKAQGTRFFKQVKATKICRSLLCNPTKPIFFQTKREDFGIFCVYMGREKNS